MGIGKACTNYAYDLSTRDVFEKHSKQTLPLLTFCCLLAQEAGRILEHIKKERAKRGWNSIFWIVLICLPFL
jgi:cation transporter-like permease